MRRIRVATLSPANGLALLPQEIAQHAGARKRIVQMQFVNPPHQRESRL
jgi:3-hydroxyacyl-CoA dehydrogenase